MSLPSSEPNVTDSVEPSASPRALRSRRRGRIPILLMATVVVVVTGGIAAVMVYAVPEDPEPVGQQSTPAPAQRRVVTPQTLVGREKRLDRGHQQFNELLIVGMKQRMPNLTGVISGHYGSREKANLVAVGAAAGAVDAPAAKLDEMFTLAFKVNGIQPVDPGPLGGVAKCGVAESNGISVVVYGWAHTGSLGLVYFYDRTSATSAEFVDIRNEIEQAV